MKTVRFNGRRAVPQSICAGVQMDNGVEQIMFILPQIAEGQTETLHWVIDDHEGTVILDHGLWTVYDAFTQYAGAHECYVEIWNNDILLWHSHPFMIHIADLPNVSGGGGGGSDTDYNNLENKPMINGVELVGNKSLSDLGAAESSDIVRIDRMLADYNSTSLIEPYIIRESTTINNVRFDWNEDGSCTLSREGTQSATAEYLLLPTMPLPHGVVAGQRYSIIFKSPDPNSVRLAIGLYGDNIMDEYDTGSSSDFDISSGITSIRIKLTVSKYANISPFDISSNTISEIALMAHKPYWMAIDKTLRKDGLAADAKATGDKIAELESEISSISGMKIHICTSSEYDAVTRIPTVQNPSSDMFYLVPAASGSSPDLFVEWIYTNNAWEQFGSASIDLSDYARIEDVPTKVSDLQNDSGFITGYTETDPTVPSWAKASSKPTYTASEVGALPANTPIPTKVSDLTDDSGHYTKPSGGIPKTDLSSTVRSSLDKADTALQGSDVSAAVETWLEENITNPDSPPLDISLSLSSAAAPADMVGELKSAFINDTEQITGNTPYVFTHGYYRVYSDLTVVDITAPERSNTTSRTMVTTLIRCQPGEKYTIRAYGAATAAAAYGYLDANQRGIYRSTAGILVDETITIPDKKTIGGVDYVPAWLIVNNNLTNNESNYYAYKGDSVATRLAAKQDALTFDSTPTSDSLNPVTSGGIYADLLSNVLRLDRTATSIPSNSDLNNYTTAGNYYVLSNATAQTIEHMPVAAPGKLIVFYTTSSANFYQVYIGSGTVAIYYRRTTGTWRRVQPILKATGDTTDIGATIVTMLESGVCQLDPGDYYVSGIEMPDDSMLIGSGPKTRIILLDSVTTGAAIKMGSRCVVKNLSVVGASSDLTFDTSGSIDSIHIGTRHGILWLGDREYGSRVFGTISDCYIHGFSGGGITCENTGYSHAGGLNAENCQIYNCGAGINVSYWSEFSRFTNINANECYYGCINNGGNNVFVNCGFTANEVGFYANGDDNKCVKYDGTTATVRNGGHGSMIGCIINHSGLGENTNHGYAIYYKTIDSGYIFDGLQIFYGKIYFRGGGFVNVSNTNFGNTVEITIYAGSIAYVFSMCRFRSGSPTFYVYSTSDGSPMTDYDAEGNIPQVKLINCYIGPSATLANLAAVAGDYNA